MHIRSTELIVLENKFTEALDENIKCHYVTNISKFEEINYAARALQNASTVLNM